MYKNILLATDFSKASNRAAKKAQLLAKQSKAKLHLVHAIELIPDYSYAYMDLADIEATLVKTSEKSLNKFAKKYNIDTKNVYAEVGHTRTVILDAAKKCKADLIIIGSHGHRGLAALLGSTANAVLHHADVDVLVIRHK